MPQCYESVALAASSNRHSSENRLTELYGTVLEAHGGFARRVLERVDLPFFEPYRVFTQELLMGSGKIDLILRGFDSSGGVRTVLYAEHKEPGGGWQEGQPQKYLKDLARETRHGAEGRLLVVVGSRKDLAGRVQKRARARIAEATAEAAQLRAGQRDRRIVFTTWQEVGGLADAAGQMAAVSAGCWRSLAAARDAPAAQRVLLELIWYLEGEGYAMAKPLTRELAGIFRQAQELDATLEALVARTTEQLMDEKIAGFWLKKPPRTSAADVGYQRFVAQSRSWVSRYDGKMYVGFEEDSDPKGSRKGQLSFSASVVLPRRQAARLEESPRFMADIKKTELRFEVDDDGGYSPES
jgi:hypothetical protein